MRTIKFRGFSKTFTENEWFYGNLIKRDNGEYIIVDTSPKTWDISHDGIQVEPNSVGQFTGLYDKHGKEIYEGDIVKLNYPKIIGLVVFDSGSFYTQKDNGHYSLKGYTIHEIIGNIHDNPELLEQ